MLEIFGVKQWLLWHRIDGRKIPLDRWGNTSGSTRVSDYLGYYEAAEAMEEIGTDGLAFCFTDLDPYGGIDLDNCLRADETLKDWARPIVDQFQGCYMEISPGLRGIKIYGKFAKPAGAPSVTACGDGQIEIYDRGRFFCFTGVEFRAGEVIDCQDAAEWLLAKYFPRVQSRVDAISVPEMGESRGDLAMRAQSYIARCETGQLTGRRNKTAFNIAGHLLAMHDGGQRLSREEVFEYVMSWNCQLDEPLDENEIERCVRNAMERGTPRAPKPGVPLVAEDPGLAEWVASMRAEQAAEPEPEPEPNPDLPFEGIEVSIDEWSERFRKKERPVLFETGIPGFQLSPGWVVVLGGGPGSGKTTLAIQAITSALLADPALTALIMSVEVNGFDLWQRILASRARVDYGQLRGMTLPDHMTPMLEQKAKALRDSLGGRLLLAKPPWDIPQLVRGAKASKPDLVVMDYIQRITPNSSRHHPDKVEAMNQCLHWARLLADCGICVLVVSSMARPEKRSDEYRSVHLTSFRGTSEVEYAANECWGLVRDRESGQITLTHLKGRDRDLCPAAHLRQGNDLLFESSLPAAPLAGDSVFRQGLSGSGEWSFDG